jgi:hypothetical protein
LPVFWNADGTETISPSVGEQRQKFRI